MASMCPVCGYHGLMSPPWTESGGGSYEICPSCSFQFGVSDDDRGISFEEWRNQWIREGMPWDEHRTLPPDGWDPLAQLRSIGIQGTRNDGQQ